MILRIVSLKVCGPTALWVEFNDGATRKVDVLPLLRGPVFEELRRPEQFSRAFLNPTTGTVEWPNGADLAPEAIRDLSESAA
jgi:hypothetical protein